MSKLTKEKPQLYVDETGMKYYGIPANAYFYVMRPELGAWIEAKHELERSDEPWNQFTPGEHFSPSGNRPPLVFQIENAIRFSVRGDATKDKYATIGEIGEDGTKPFEGSIRFEMSGTHEDSYTKASSGYVCLLTGTVGSKTDTLLLTVKLTESLVESIYRELIARPEAMLSVRLNFAYYQDEMDARHIRGAVLLERDAHIPILEASVSVVDVPHDWAGDSQSIEAPGEAVSPMPVIAQPDFAPLVMRLNWALGLLTLLILVMLFK